MNQTTIGTSVLVARTTTANYALVINGQIVVAGKSAEEGGVDIPLLGRNIASALGVSPQTREIADDQDAPDWERLIAQLAPTTLASTVCERCASALTADGYCTDDTCPHSDWPQSVDTELLTEHSKEDIERMLGIRKRLRITAEVHSDDRVHELEFDAAPWFRDADVKAILELQAIDWGQDYAADVVAEHLADSHADIATLLQYCVRKSKGDDAVGFEVTVDRVSAMTWLAVNRPELHAIILCEENGVTLSEAQEDQVKGMWDWILPTQRACDCSFATKGEAALDAVATLKLGVSHVEQ